MDLEIARDFWKVANTFPADKEAYYPAHADAHEFEAQAKPCTDGYQKRVLEYGCGGGSDTISLLRRGARVSFVDIVTENVRMTQHRILIDDQENDFENSARAAGRFELNSIGFVLERSDALPFDDCCFDSVNCHGVLHHIEERLMERVITEFHRVLRSGGKLYAMLYTEHLFERCGPAMDGLVQAHSWPRDRAFGYLTDGGNDKSWCIARAYTERGGRELFERLGFEVERSVVYNDGDFRTFRCKKVGV